MEFYFNPYHDLTTDRWHPMYWRESPRPSYQPGDWRRVRSGGHHTTGFATEAEAKAFQTDTMEPDFARSSTVHYIQDMQGPGVGAMTIDLPPVRT